MRLATTLPLALALALAACASAPAPRPPPIATPAGPLARIEASVDAGGTIVGSSDARATIVVLFASWCGHCRAQLRELAQVRDAHPDARILGLNYKAHEEYDGRGSSDTVRAYVRAHAPWLRVVPADDALFTALGRPPFVPTVLVYDRAGALIARFDRRDRGPPDAAELAQLLARLD